MAGRPTDSCGTKTCSQQIRNACKHLWCKLYVTSSKVPRAVESLEIVQESQNFLH